MNISGAGWLKALATGMAPKVAARRLMESTTKLHMARDVPHVFETNAVRVASKAAVKTSNRRKVPKSEKPITLDVLNALLKTCERSRPIDLRDAAMLLVAFASGGRRRAELGSSSKCVEKSLVIV